MLVLRISVEMLSFTLINAFQLISLYAECFPAIRTGIIHVEIIRNMPPHEPVFAVHTYNLPVDITTLCCSFPPF